MGNVREYAVGGEAWKIRQVQALDDDPMVHGARYTFSVESEKAGFEVEVVLAPIYFHLASARERLELGSTAARLVCDALDAGVRTAAQVRVSSDGVAMLDGAPLAQLFVLVKPEPPPKPKPKPHQA